MYSRGCGCVQIGMGTWGTRCRGCGCVQIGMGIWGTRCTVGVVVVSKSVWVYGEKMYSRGCGCVQIGMGIWGTRCTVCVQIGMGTWGTRCRGCGCVQIGMGIWGTRCTVGVVVVSKSVWVYGEQDVGVVSTDVHLKVNIPTTDGRFDHGNGYVS